MASDIDQDARPGSDFLTDIGADEAPATFTPPALLDTVAPVSWVAPLDPVIRVGTFQLTLFAADDSGLPVTVAVYYRFNGGAWLTAGQTMLTSSCAAPFNFDSQLTPGDGPYEFYSVATDSGGNVEAAPPEPDASTLVAKPFPDNCVYVDPNATGTPTGEGWATAFHTISDAVATARDNALPVIRVASGRYSENIQCFDGITIYGGFQPGTVLRDPLVRPSILCGVFEYYDPNLQPSVVTMDGLTSAGLDGLVITGGANAWGGGLLVRGGAGITINNCVITGNNSQYAGGVWCDQGAAPLITNCRIVGNSASQCGGGLAVTTGSLPRLVNCLLDGNTATSQGGAVYVAGLSAPELIHCTVRGNAAAGGGAVAMTGLAGQPSPPRFINSIFSTNTGTAFVEREAGFSPVLQDCFFDSNTGGDYLDSGTTLLTGAASINAMPAGASGNLDGAPAFLATLQGTWSATPVYSSSTGRTTFTNSAATFTPSALVGRFANPNPLKCLPALILANTTTTLQVLGDLTAAKRNDSYQILDDHLGIGSMAIDRVGGADLPATDLDGAPRPFDVPGQGIDLSGVTGDIGAYEAHPTLGLAGVSFSMLDFGSVIITAGPPGVQSLIISNPGTVVLAFTGPGFQITGINSGAFTFVSAPAITPLAPGASRTIQISFSPAVIGLHTAILSITTNDPAQPLREIALRGTGVPPEIQIAVQPAPQTVNPGATATFTITATGTPPLSYQWKKDGATLSDGGRLSGTQTAALQITLAAFADAGYYACEVRNPSGSLLSNPARLVINPTLTVASAHGTPSPSSGPHAYTTGTLVNARINGSPELDTTGTTRYLATGWTGSGSVLASGATTQTSFILTVDSLLTWQWKLQRQLAARAVPLSGGRVTLTDGATPADGLWFDDSSPARIAEIPASGYVFAGWSGDATGLATTASLVMSRPRSVTATFLMLPRITTPPAPQTVDPGANVSFGVTATGSAPLSYQWKKDGIPLTNNSNISGATLATLQLSSATTVDAGFYSCLVSNSAGTTESLSARLIVNPTLTVSSPHGTPSPALGPHTFTTGTFVNASVSGSPELDTTGTTRFIATGWTGTGSVPSSGATTQTSFLLGLDSALAWQWQTQFQLKVVADPPIGGRVTLDDGVTSADGSWHASASRVTLEAFPANGWDFIGWTGSLAGGTTSASLVMTQPLQVTAHFLQRSAASAQPAFQVVDPGVNVNLTVLAADLVPLTYHWKKDGLPLSDGGRISGATLTTLTLNAVTMSDAGRYSCLVTNVAGTTESSPARLVVNPTLTVVSACGSPDPTLGSHAFTTGTLVDASISGSPELDIYGTTRDIATGWTGTGSVPASGAATATAFILDRDSILTWQWKTENQLAATANPTAGGRITLADGVTFADGAWFGIPVLAQIRALPEPGWVFAGWSGDASGPDPTTSLVMDLPRAVTANFLMLPLILTQPTAQVVDPDSTLNFSISADGSPPLAYHWLKDGIPLNDDGHLSGATLSTMELRGVTTADAGFYSCLVNNGAGSTVSISARLAVNPTLTVASAHGSPSPSPGPHVYSAGTLVNASVSGSPELDTTGTTRYLATGWLGTGSVPASGAASSTAFTLDADSALTWQWKTQRQLAATADPPAGGRVTLPDGATPANGLWFDNPTLARVIEIPASGWYFAGWSGDASGLSTTASLVMSRPRTVTATFLMLPRITTQPTSQTVALGTPADLSVVALGGAPLAYQWFKDGAPLSGETSPALQFAAVSKSDEGDYACHVSNAGGYEDSWTAHLRVLMPGLLAAAPVTLRFVEGTPYAVDVEHGGQPTTQTLTLTNTGDQILTFTGGDVAMPGLKITGAAAADYMIERVTPSTSAPLVPGASVEIIIKFAPAEIKRTLGLAAALTVTSDSPLTPSFSIPLLGDAVPVELSSFKVE